MGALARTKFLRRAELCSIAGINIRTAQRRLDALKARGLLNGDGRTGFWLTDAGWEHPAAAAVKVAQSQVVIDQAATRSAVDLEIEREATEAARLRAERANLEADAAEAHARELRARRAGDVDEHAIGRDLARHDQAIARLETSSARAERRQRTADLVKGLAPRDVLVLFREGSVQFEDLPAGHKRGLLNAANAYCRARGRPERGLDAIALAAVDAEQYLSTQPERTAMPSPRAQAERQRGRQFQAAPAREWEWPASVQWPRTRTLGPARAAPGAPAFLRRQAAVPGLTLPRAAPVEQPLAFDGASWRERAMQAGWRWPGRFSDPPECQHGWPPGRCPLGCRLPAR